MNSSSNCLEGPEKVEAPKVEQRPKIGLAQMPILILMKAAENAAKFGLATITRTATSWTVEFSPPMSLSGQTESSDEQSAPAA